MTKRNNFHINKPLNARNFGREMLTIFKDPRIRLWSTNGIVYTKHLVVQQLRECVKKKTETRTMTEK